MSYCLVRIIRVIMSFYPSPPVILEYLSILVYPTFLVIVELLHAHALSPNYYYATRVLAYFVLGVN